MTVTDGLKMLTDYTSTETVLGDSIALALFDIPSIEIHTVASTSRLLWTNHHSLFGTETAAHA